MTIVLCAYGVMSALCFLAYGVDKAKAKRGSNRIPEANFHLLELAGGFPGGFIAQHVFRHKRRKTRYLLVFLLIVAAHAAGWAAWWWFAGS